MTFYVTTEMSVAETKPSSYQLNQNKDNLGSTHFSIITLAVIRNQLS